MKEQEISILLIEDDEVEVMKVQRAFKKNNFPHRLYVAENGVEALEILRTAPNEEIEIFPKIILLDLNMPKMNGIEFLRKLREDSGLRKMVVIVLTTSNDERDVVSAYDLNAAGYIVKPVTFQKFVEAISTLDHYWNLCELP